MHLFLQEGYGKDEVRLFYVNAPLTTVRSEQDSYGSTTKTYAGAFQMSHVSCHRGQFRFLSDHLWERQRAAGAADKVAQSSQITWSAMGLQNLNFKAHPHGEWENSSNLWCNWRFVANTRVAAELPVITRELSHGKEKRNGNKTVGQAARRWVCTTNNQ